MPMRLCYVLLSPTFGMHQYTADIANRMALAGHEVHLVTTRRYPPDRYLPAVTVHTPVDTRDSGFSPDALNPSGVRTVHSTIRELKPEVVHFTGPHLWDLPLLWALRREGTPTVHSLHDLYPHVGASYGQLLCIWNRLVIDAVDRTLVHGICYRERLLARRVGPERVTYAPLLHLFLGPAWLKQAEEAALQVSYEPWALFFGRLERYKGLEDLLAACALLPDTLRDRTRVVVAGPGSLRALWTGAFPPQVELRERFIGDEEALDLFRRCGLLVLPYRDASQSALIAAAYFFRKPVIVTRVGALPEYVQEGRTGFLVEPGDPAGLARTLAKALTDPGCLAQMGATGRAWYEAQRKIEEETLQRMYAQIIRENSNKCREDR